MEFPLLIVLCRCAALRFALPAVNVTRVLGAAQFVAVAGLHGCAVGVVNVADSNLALCDPRPVLDLPSAELQPTHRFIELEALTGEPRRWLLWVEEVLAIQTVSAAQTDILQTSDGAAVSHALRLPFETVPLLNLSALEPQALTRDR